MTDLYLFPMSANPLHIGHLSIIQYMEEKYGCEVIAELCCQPFDKPKLSNKEISRRENQFFNLGRRVVLSENSSFITKAIQQYDNLHKVISNKFFVCGYDTIQRIDDKKYYYDSEKEKSRALTIINKLGWKFHVMPRHDKICEGLSPQMKSMCIFHKDYQEMKISSTEIRKNKELLDKNRYLWGCYLKQVNIEEMFLYNGEFYIKKTETEDTVVAQYGEEFFVMKPNTYVFSQSPRLRHYND